MNYKEIFQLLWNDYVKISPSAKRILELFALEGETVENDHVAFRTFDKEACSMDKLSRFFIENGYKQIGSYNFEEKKLFAKHFEHASDPSAPRVFISELLTSHFSSFLQETVDSCVARISDTHFSKANSLVSGAVWGTASYQTYLKLREESEYAAWLYVYGFRVNHFTVSINALKKFPQIEQVNKFLKGKGYRLNDAGGEIKGSPAELLEQSSTLAEIIPVKFTDGIFNIPSCYYEFAKRYADQDGNLYSGFIAKSADKIFESTNFYPQ